MLIQNGIVFTQGRLRKGVSVRTAEGVICEAGALSPRAGEEVLDAGGAYVLPGFVDIHIHGYKAHDCMEGEEAVRAMSRDLGETGVAAFVPDDHERWARGYPRRAGGHRKGDAAPGASRRGGARRAPWRRLT